MSTTFLGKIADGNIFIDGEYNRRRFKDFLQKNEGKAIRIERVSGSVTDKQRGYYWGAVLPFLQSLVPSWKDLTDEQVNEICKKEWNGFTALNPVTKRIEKFGQSVSSKSKESDEFGEFLMRIADWVMENYGQTLPNPDEYKAFVDRVEWAKPLTPVK